MKQLTRRTAIIDYEKAFKGLVERIKKLHIDYLNDDDVYEVTDYIEDNLIPQSLKEAGDGV